VRYERSNPGTAPQSDFTLGQPAATGVYP
jgi:hypothetical protein